MPMQEIMKKGCVFTQPCLDYQETGYPIKEDDVSGRAVVRNAEMV